MKPLFAFALSLSLPAATIAGDWPHFLGPAHDSHSEETGLLRDFPPGGPKILWQVERGAGHAPPVISGDALVFSHGKGETEVIECLDAGTGKSRWRVSYPVENGENYGITDAPRSSPVIDPATGLVFTLGNDSDLHAIDLKTGEVKWKTRLSESFGPAPFFFGQGSCPLVFGGRLIVHAGVPGACVVAYDPATGEILWKASHEWFGSYSSPIPGRVNGQDRIFVLAGGKTDPPVGGLLCVNPENGAIDAAVPWRSRMYTSVLAACPVPCGENRVFITEDYGRGGAMIEFDRDFRARIAWEAPDFNCQFQTPVYHDGFLYGFSGSGGLLVCYEAANGRLRWSEAFIRLTVPWQDRELAVNLGRGNLLRVDGRFLCLGANGTLLWLDLSPDAGARVLAKAQLFYAPETWAIPVVHDGKLYVNQSEMGSRLICCQFR